MRKHCHCLLLVVSHLLDGEHQPPDYLLPEDDPGGEVVLLPGHPVGEILMLAEC